MEATLPLLSCRNTLAMGILVSFLQMCVVLCKALPCSAESYTKQPSARGGPAWVIWPVRLLSSLPGLLAYSTQAVSLLTLLPAPVAPKSKLPGQGSYSIP